MEEIIRGVELKEGSGLPLPRRVAGGLRELIESGRLEPGQKLPSTARMAELLGVSRQVAQEGLSLLADENLVRRRSGLGTMVLEPRDSISAGLLVYMGGPGPVSAHAGWAITHAFLNITRERGWDYRQYSAHDAERPAECLPRNLVTDMVEGAIDILVAGLVTPGIVEEVVPDAVVPIRYMIPERSRGRSAASDAARWLWRQDCEKVGLITTSLPEADGVTDFFGEKCDDFQIDIPDPMSHYGCTSSIRVGRGLFHELYGGEAAPDGLMIMDDLIAHGLLEEAREQRHHLDLSSIVVWVNKGSELYIPAACPRVELDWEQVAAGELDLWLEESGRGAVDAGREPYGFVPHGRRMEEQQEWMNNSKRDTQEEKLCRAESQSAVL